MPERSPVENIASPPPPVKATTWHAVCLVVIFAGYFLFFVAADPKRQLALSLLLLPDQVVQSWSDGDWDRFGLFDRMPIVAAAAMILLAAYLVGRWVLKRLGAERLSSLELAVFGTGVGLNLISLYTLAVGLAGGLQSRLAFLAPGVVLLAASAWQAKGKFSSTAIADAFRVKREPSTSERTATRIALGLSVPFVLAIMAGSLLPPWHFDTREYHAQVPKEWYQQGAVTFMPHNVYGNMPLGVEMHAIVGMNLMTGDDNWWWGALVGKAIIAAYAPLTALALFAFGRRYLSSAGGAVAAFVFISTPWVAHVSTSGLIDGASAFYLFATFYVLLLWYDRAKSAEAMTPYLVLAGLLAGSAVACKYPAVLFVVVPGVVATACLPLGRLHVRSALIFLSAVVLACGLWFGKNLVLADNPTYPLLYDVFGGKTRTAEKDRQWTTAHGPPRDAAGRSLTWDSLRSSASLLVWRSEFASPLLVPLAGIGLVAAAVQRLPTRPVWLAAALIAFNIVAWWLLTHRIDRFLVPILPLVALLASAGATALQGRAWQRAVTVILCCGSAFNLAFVASPLAGDNRFLTAYEVLRRDEPSTGPFSVQRLHMAHKYLNAHVPPGYAVLAVGEAQVFDLDMPVFYNTCFDDCFFEQLMKGRTPDQRRQALRERHISHVFISWYELDRYRSPGNYGYSDYVTRELIQREFVDTGLLREVPVGLDIGNSQVFEVVGWQTWQPSAAGP